MVYIADEAVVFRYELYSVPIAGGSSTKLNGALTAGGGVLGADRAAYQEGRGEVGKPHETGLRS